MKNIRLRGYYYRYWPFSWIPSLIYGQSKMRIDFTLGMSWLDRCVCVSLLWDTDKCRHVR